MNMHFSLPAAAQMQLGSADPSMEMIFDGNHGLVMYMRSPLFDRVVPTGKWVKMDVAKLANLLIEWKTDQRSWGSKSGRMAIERVEVNRVARRLDVHPAALAAQVAGIDDREVEERREVFATLHAPLEPLDRQHALHAEVPRRLPQAALVRRAQDSTGQSR